MLPNPISPMTTLVYIVMLLCLLAVSAKLSLIGSWRTLIYGALLGLFAWLVMPWAIDSSRNEVASYLASLKARQYVAIWVTIECALVLAFAFRQWSVSKSPEELRHEGRWASIKLRLMTPLWWLQKYYISLLVLPTLFFIETQVIYALPGVAFELSALLVALGSLLFFPLTALLFRWALPLRGMREELVLSLSILLCISALLSTTSEEILFAPMASSRAPFILYLLALIVFLIFFGAGFFLELRRKYRSARGHR